ncbi:hypothetical protein M0R45_001070 [Rubus argutus]
MHDLVQEMGRAIDRGIEDPGKRKRLWNAEDAYQVLHNKTGTSTVEAIFLDVSKIRELQLSPAAFRNMHNLKLLNFYVPQEVHEEHKRQRRWSAEEKQLSSFPWLPGLKVVQSFLAKSRIWESLKLLDVYRKVCNYNVEVFKKYCKIYLPGGLESLPEELRYLYWDGYPLKSLPSQYFPENLVELHLPHSQVKQLWDNVQNLGSLKNLNLSDSQHLTQVPDLSGSPNIERINLSWCTSLVEVPSYFQNLENLTSLDLEECRNLKIFRELPCNLEMLNLSGTAIEEISPSIWSHEKLHTVDLLCCRDLKNLPSSSSNTTKLENLTLRGCSSLESIPDSIYDLNRLEILDLYGCEKLKRLPPLPVGRLRCLTYLDLSWCEVLESIPDNLLSLSTVELIDLSETMIESIPSNIVNASRLRDLFLRNCKKLKVIPELPWQLENLNARGCTSLKSVASSRSAPMQQSWEQYKGFGYHGDSLKFSDCLELDESARSNIMGGAQLRIMQMASSSPKREGYDAFIAICPGKEIPGWFSYHYQTEGWEINNVKFHPDWFHKTTTRDHCLNLVVSAVVVANSECALPSNLLFVLVCECTFKTNDGEGYQYKYRSPEFLCPKTSSSVNSEEDHVVAFFRKDTFWREGKIITQASFHLYPEYFNKRDEGRMKVKKYGIRILDNQ